MLVVQKTAEEILPYEFDFGDWTVFDSFPITGATIVATGLTVGTPTVSGKIVQVRISGGTNGQVYNVNCKPITADGYKGEVQFKIAIVNP